MSHVTVSPDRAVRVRVAPRIVAKRGVVAPHSRIFIRRARALARRVRVAGALEPAALGALEAISGALWWGDASTGRAYAQALAGRDGPILPLITGLPDKGHVAHERHVCVDTTASGGNAALLSGMS